MRIPPEKIEIPEEKITDYLLVQKAKNDKLAFLFKLGYSTENAQESAQDIKYIATNYEALLQQKTQFGEVYEVKGKLKSAEVITIWLLRTDADKFRFITSFLQ